MPLGCPVPVHVLLASVAPAEVLVHLIEAERELWVPRMDAILRAPIGARFTAFERESNFDRARTTPVHVSTVR